MSQWHQFQVTKRNNISYQIYSTKDDRLEKLTYSFFGFSIVNWIAENEQLYRCCYTDVVGSPSPFGLPCGRGEGNPQDFGFVTMKFAWFPKLPFLIYPPFPIKACNPPQIFHQLHTSWSSNYHNCNKICARRFLYLKPEYTTEFESTWAIMLKQLFASGSGKIFLTISSTSSGELLNNIHLAFSE